MKTLTIGVDDKYVKILDKVIKQSGLYSSRSEFMKDAVREKMFKLLNFDKEFNKFKKINLKETDLKMLSKKDRQKLAEKFAEENTSDIFREFGID